MATQISDFDGQIQVVGRVEDFWPTIVKLPTEEDS